MNKIILFILLLSIKLAFAANLTVTVSNIIDKKGQMIISLYNNKASFPIEGKEYRAIIVYPITAATITTTFNNIPSGTYAVAVIHDEDRSGKLEKNIFGIPMEQYGFSNDVYAKFGPPTFESAAFTINKEDLLITINLK